jgi:hypothetical protein
MGNFQTRGDIYMGGYLHLYIYIYINSYTNKREVLAVFVQITS